MRGFVPNLRGRGVMVYPVQIRQGVPGNVDAEIAFALRDRGTEIDWVFRKNSVGPSIELSPPGVPWMA